MSRDTALAEVVFGALWLAVDLIVLWKVRRPLGRLIRELWSAAWR